MFLANHRRLCRGLIRNITVRNMKVATAPSHNSIFSGYSPKHNISGVTFDGLEIAGKKILSVKDSGMYLNHVKDIRFLPGK